METIKEIREYETVVGLPAPDSLIERTRQWVSLALRSFHQGMKYYPNISRSMDKPFKDQEWRKMATLADLYTDLTDEYPARQMWSQHTIKLLKGALHEDRSKACQLQQQLSKVYLQFALWIHEQPDKPLLLFPKVSPMFHEMQRSAIAALIYAKHAMHNAQAEDMHPDLYCQVINSLYMMSLVCISPHLIHAYSRRAAYWIDQLRVKFPWHK
ncbi:hypothetical protein BGZ65_009764, partial [Modicella reniformis]